MEATTTTVRGETKVPYLVIQRDKLKWATVAGLTIYIIHSRGNVVYATPKKVLGAYMDVYKDPAVRGVPSELTVVKHYLETISKSEYGLGSISNHNTTYYIINARKIKEVAGENIEDIENLLAEVIMDA